MDTEPRLRREPRRLAHVLVSAQEVLDYVFGLQSGFVKQVTGIPEDAKFVSCHYDLMRKCFVIEIESPSFEECSEYMISPALCHGYATVGRVITAEADGSSGRFEDIPIGHVFRYAGGTYIKGVEKSPALECTGIPGSTRLDQRGIGLIIASPAEGGTS